MSVKKARDWRAEFQQTVPQGDAVLLEGRAGLSTLKAGDILLHSQYRPIEEAGRLIDAAALDAARPVLVIGLGLGYHVQVLLNRGFEVLAADPNPRVVHLALEGPLADVSDCLIGVGDADEIATSSEFETFAMRNPQVLVHPPSARLYPRFVEQLSNRPARIALSRARLRIAIVGPMYGGSLPIAQHLDRAFTRIGHRTLFVDNSVGWPLYESAAATVQSKKGKAQLSDILLNFLNEWTYARVAEFEPAFCIVLAQAPVHPQFPRRLRKHGIVTAYWFVENWRHMSYWEAIAPEYDYFFHIQPDSLPSKLDAANCPHHAFVPTGCDPDLHRPITLTAQERAEYGCDISFAGAGYRNRNHVFSALTDYNLKLWGVEWSAPELHPHVQGGNRRFDTDEYIRIVAGSKINLNLHASATHTGINLEYDAANPRIFEVAACGGFQLCDAFQGIDRFFDPGTELPTYRDLPEMRERIDHFLANPEERGRFAQRARERALRDHTYDTRARTMIDLLLDAYGAYVAAQDAPRERTIGDIRSQLVADSPLSTFLKTLPQDLSFTQEGIAPYLPTLGEPWGEADGIFAYLAEMRSFSEKLLASHEG